ncbi:MAG: cell surface protein SprA, partial [Bacteroidales bacterium]
FITDIRQAQVHLDNGKNTNVKWYQFKIPIRNPQKTVGQIENFQSIRFIRMFMRDFKEPVVLRFASLDLVKSDWRKYQQPLLEDGLHSSAGSEATEFDVAVVGIEENSRRMPIPYVLPPGIKRTTDPASQNNKQLNEQSLSLKVLDLADGDARGVYKNTNYDFRQFKKVEMDVHLEKVKEMDRAEDGDVQLFIRFGADFQDNYYEYEIPLSYTQWGESARDLVWPESNKVEIILDDLVNIKEHRNLLIRSGKSELSYATPYSEQIGKARYTVKGTPAISTVKSILIGIRNPLKHRYNDGDDGAPRSVEVWIDELSLNDFNKKGGVAATARIQASLGDLGNISVAGAYTSANFGTMEQKLTELPKNNTGSYDVSVNLELGKFIPEKAGVKLPVHYDISSVISNPEYNPLDPDIKTKEDLATYSKADKKEVKKQIQDYTLRQNVNFINVRKERTNTEKQPMFWDIENFNLSYSYSSTYHRNEDIEYDNRISHRGGFGYDFSTSPKYFEPLAKTKLADKKIFDILTDFNINYIPNQFSFNMEIFREFTENKLRNKNPEWHLLINPTFYKRFDWTRYYNFHYDLTKSISIGYTANANSFLNEPPGKINTADKKDSVWRSFGQGGSMRNFDQNLNITYTLPINKIPILDWINANASYGSIYRWEAGPLATQERLGNTISNNLNLSATGSVNLVGLYNKVPFLKKINTPSRNNNRRQSKSNEVMATNKEEEKKDTETWKKIYSGALRVLMLVRDASITWSRNQGSALPGFMLEPDLFGNNFNFNAPGAAFSLFGSQRDIRQKAAMEGWLSKDSL